MFFCFSYISTLPHKGKQRYLLLIPSHTPTSHHQTAPLRGKDHIFARAGVPQNKKDAQGRQKSAITYTPCIIKKKTEAPSRRATQKQYPLCRVEKASKIC